MSESINELVRNSLLYYDKNYETFSKKIKKIKYYKVIHSSNKRSCIILYDENKKQIIESEYENIGIYDKNSKLWTWAWAVPFFNKYNINLSRKVLNYALDIDTITEMNIFLKSELVTSRFIVNNNIQLDLHVAISSYISKQPIVINIATNLDNNYTEYVPINKNNDSSSSLSYYIFLLTDKL